MRGFTLVEVLAALAVVGIAMLALIVTSGGYTRQSAELRDRTIAHWIAADRIAEYRIDGRFPEPTTERGETIALGERWAWTIVVSPAPGEDDLRRLDVAIARADTPNDPVAVVTGFVGRNVGFPRVEGVE